MASSRLVGTRAPLLLPDFNSASSPLDQAPISPPRAALSPARPASPGLHGFPLRPIGALSPSRLVPAPPPLASARSLPGALEIVSSSVSDMPLSLPTKAVPEATDAPHLDAVMDLTTNVETVTGAHILGAAVALLASTTEVRSEQEPPQLSQDASTADTPPEKVEGEETAVCLESASLSQEDGLPTPPTNPKVNVISDAMPWWLAANGDSEGAREQSNGAHESWWSQQVQAARAKEQQQEAKALQESLHRHKGPDAPYALEGADHLLGAASPSLGEPLGGGAWWSQLTKIPTEDWLHLEQPQNRGEEMLAAKADKKPLDEHRDQVALQAERIEAAAIDGRGFLTDFEDIVSPDALAMTMASISEVPSTEQSLVSETQDAVEAEEERAAVAFADNLVEGAFIELPASPVLFPSGAEDGTDVSLITSAILLAAEGLILDHAIAPSDLQLASQASEHQANVELNSPVEKTEVLAALPLVLEDTLTNTYKLNIDAQLTLAPTVSAPLAPAQPASDSLELASVALLGVATESEAAVDPAQDGVIAMLPSPKSAVNEARARLETIKAWRSSRPQTPTLTVPTILAPPSPSGLPSLSLVSGVFPTRGSPRVASSGSVDGSIWKTLQDMEWATESTADTFGRSSVAAHLAERHDEKH